MGFITLSPNSLKFNAYGNQFTSAPLTLYVSLSGFAPGAGTYSHPSPSNPLVQVSQPFYLQNGSYQIPDYLPAGTGPGTYVFSFTDSAGSKASATFLVTGTEYDIQAPAGGGGSVVVNVVSTSTNPASSATTPAIIPTSTTSTGTSTSLNTGGNVSVTAAASSPSNTTITNTPQTAYGGSIHGVPLSGGSPVMTQITSGATGIAALAIAGLGLYLVTKRRKK